MKNLKNYLISGMIGLGSLAGFKGYGQDTSKTTEIPELTVKAQSIDHQEFQIETWREFGDGEIVLNKYFDTNLDGEIDSFSVFSYSPKRNKVEINENGTPDRIVSLFPIWVKKNYSLGKTFMNCEEGYFKEDIYDYIK